MKLHTRRHGSQRSSEPVEVEFTPNFSGQGGEHQLTLQTKEEKPKYFIVTFDSLEEVIQLLSQAHIVHHNFHDHMRMEEVKRSFK